MDFKVAGTESGITALQMDIKISGVTFQILRDALEQARRGRLAHPRDHGERHLRPRARSSRTSRRGSPRSRSIPERIGTVIGKGGETIRGLEAEYNVEISIEDDGTVSVYGVEGAKAKACVETIRAMTKDVEVGDTFNGAQGRQDDDLRRVRRAHQGRGRPAAHLEPVGRTGRQGRGRHQPR